MDNYLTPELDIERQRALRRQKIAESMLMGGMQPIEQQQGGVFTTPISPFQVLGKLAGVYAGQKGIERGDADMSGIGERYNTGLADAIKKYQDTKDGSVIPPLSAGGFSVTNDDEGNAMPEARKAGDPRAAVTQAITSQYAPLREMGKLDYAQLNKPPVKTDLGDRIKVEYPDGRIAYEPKAVSPDARLRADTTTATHAAPSGSAILQNQGATDRHVTPSGSAVLANQGANARHATPSGSAQLGAQTTLQTHATPSGSARLSAQTALQTHATPSGSAVLGAETARRGQDQAVNPVIQQGLAQARAAGTATGESQAQAALAVPQVAAKAVQALDLINQMIGDTQVNTDGTLKAGNVPPHAGFSGVVGAGFPGARFVPGTSAASFAALLDQVKSGAFLQAFESIKGAGAITEKEGEKATQAITRMGTAQSEPEFVKAAREYESAISAGVQRLRERAGVGAGPAIRMVDW